MKTRERLQLDFFGPAADVDAAPKPIQTTDRQKLIADTVQLLVDRPPPPENAPLIVSYGGGTNSTALIIAMQLKGIRPDEIIFSDTGNEKPETYQFMERFNGWLKSVGFPEITVVRYQLQNPKPRRKVFKYFRSGAWKTLRLAVLDAYTKAWVNHLQQNWRYENLGENCLVTEALPSKAYGSGSCSAKWKVEVVQAYTRHKYGCQVRQVIGLHAGEKQRLLMNDGTPKKLATEHFYNEYPLILWGLEQQHCNALCLSVLGEVPPKSSCWFCPNARLSEVKELRDKYPELYEQGCYIEELGMAHMDKSHQIKGLGRSFSWRNLDNLTPLEIAAIEAEKAGRKCSCTD